METLHLGIIPIIGLLEMMSDGHSAERLQPEQCLNNQRWYVHDILKYINISDIYIYMYIYKYDLFDIYVIYP